MDGWPSYNPFEDDYWDEEAVTAREKDRARIERMEEEMREERRS